MGPSPSAGAASGACRSLQVRWGLASPRPPFRPRRPTALLAPKTSETKYLFKNFCQPITSWIFPIKEIMKHLIFPIHGCFNLFIKILPTTQSIWWLVPSLLENHLFKFSGMAMGTRSTFTCAQWRPQLVSCAPGRAADGAEAGRGEGEGRRGADDLEILLSNLS